MLAFDLLDRLSALPVLAIGVALLVWNRRLASAAGDRTFARAFEFKVAQRILDGREAHGWYGGLVRVFVIVLGALFVVVGLGGLAFGPTA